MPFSVLCLHFGIQPSDEALRRLGFLRHQPVELGRRCGRDDLFQALPLRP